jgi:hypothetical protein
MTGVYVFNKWKVQDSAWYNSKIYLMAFQEFSEKSVGNKIFFMGFFYFNKGKSMPHRSFKQ